jgi:hypothetical protein
MKSESFGKYSTMAQLNRFLYGMDELGLLNDKLIIDIAQYPEKYAREYDLIEVYLHYLDEFRSQPGLGVERSELDQEASKAIRSDYTADQLDKDLAANCVNLAHRRDRNITRPTGSGNLPPTTRLEGVAKKYQSKAGGLNDKGRAHYNSKGHKLKKPVSKGQAKKSKKSAGRRKSFCSRMGGQKKMHNIDCRADPDKAICKSLKRWDCNEAFEKALDDALGLTEGAGGHEYRNLTSNTFEKKLSKANRLAMSNSGRLHYDQLNNNCKDLIKQAEAKRPLRKSEFINLHGYDAWLKHCLDNDIPEDSKYAAKA